VAGFALVTPPVDCLEEARAVGQKVGKLSPQVHSLPKLQRLCRSESMINVRSLDHLKRLTPTLIQSVSCAFRSSRVSRVTRNIGWVKSN
jgi:hypothetical protein